jgi:hypothetical protein
MSLWQESGLLDLICVGALLLFAAGIAYQLGARWSIGVVKDN